MTKHPVYTECIHCDQVIEAVGEYYAESDDMYIDCPSCKQEMIVWNWFGEED